MTTRRYNIRFPASEPHVLSQDQAYFLLQENSHTHKIRFHDYAQLYSRPGLYEQLFYERLKCSSTEKVSSLLKQAVDQVSQGFSQLRVLDVGAGNGMMGLDLFKLGVARIVGVDILPEAMRAAERDRPGVYDAYYVLDLTRISELEKKDLVGWQLDCMTSVAALGFADIPASAFVEAFNLIAPHGWVAFNIKSTFLENQDTSGFSLLIKRMIVEEYLEIHHLERYQHRLSIDGRPLYYFAAVGIKQRDISSDFPQHFYRKNSTESTSPTSKVKVARCHTQTIPTTRR